MVLEGTMDAEVERVLQAEAAGQAQVEPEPVVNVSLPDTTIN